MNTAASAVRLPAAYYNPILAKLSPLTAGIVRFDMRRGKVVSREALYPGISTVGHIVTTLLFVALVLVYAVVVLALHFTRPQLEEFQQLPATELPPIPLTLEVSCSNPPFCGTVSVVVNYTAAPHCIAAGLAPLTQRVLTLPSMSREPQSVDVDLCYTPDALFTANTRDALLVPGIVVDFTEINPGVVPPAAAPSVASRGSSSSRRHEHNVMPPAPERKAHGVVVVRSRGPLAGDSLRRQINMDSWQVKSFIVGQSATRVEGALVDHHPTSVAIEYAGIRPSFRATLIIAMSPFANTFTKSRPGDLITVIGSIGGATFFLASVFVTLTPLWRLIFPATWQEVAASPTSPH